jgi:hypothetical protein
MRANDFRRLALGMSGAVEASHMDHPDFRVNGRVFATLHGDGRFGMVKLTPEQQQRVIRQHPNVFSPENGAWGRQGCTRVQLDVADEETVGEAMTLAWQNTSRQPATRRRIAAKRPAARRTPRR